LGPAAQVYNCFDVRNHLCRITVIDAAGLRLTLEIEAPTARRAAFYFWAKVRSDQGLPRIMFKDDTVYEIRRAGSKVVHKLTHRQMLGWANQEAERAAQRLNRLQND
jgi:hypothetical protein